MSYRIAILAEFPLGAIRGKAEGRGGGQTCTWLPQLAQAFAENKGFEIHWLILDRTIFRTVTIKILGQYFHRIPSVRFSLNLLLNYLPARVVLGRKIRNINPDIVHAWGTEHIYSCALHDFKGPTILSMQGILTEYARIGGLPKNWLWKKMIHSEPKFIRSATIVTSESQWGIDRVKEIDSSADCRKVEYGVHPSFYDLEWKPDPDIPYMLYVGGSGIRKGLDILIDALKLIPDRKWEIRMAGDSALLRECESAGLDRFSCLGLLSWDEMKKQLQGAWCSVLPTRGDTSPNSVKEARVVGLPVITTIHGGQAGYIRDGENGKVLSDLNAYNLADSMQFIMASYSQAKSMGACRHQIDRKYFLPKNTADDFMKLYHELTSNAAERI